MLDDKLQTQPEVVVRVIPDPEPEPEVGQDSNIAKRSQKEDAIEAQTGEKVVSAILFIDFSTLTSCSEHS